MQYTIGLNTTTMIIIGITVLVALLMFRQSNFDDAKELKQKVQNGALLVDVRSISEYETAHIKQAIHIPINEIMNRMEEFGNKQREIVVYCRSGVRSARAQKILLNHGYMHVYNLGGMNRWPQK